MGFHDPARHREPEPGAAIQSLSCQEPPAVPARERGEDQLALLLLDSVAGIIDANQKLPRRGGFERELDSAAARGVAKSVGDDAA